MRTSIILQLATLLVLLLGTSTDGLFFSYPKNALLSFFQSLHGKKEVKKPPSIHHYHMHYYPVHTQPWAKPVKAPEKLELDKLHSNTLELLGWNEHEYSHIPEPTIYRTSPPQDAWPESSLTRPWFWDENLPEYPSQSLEQHQEVPKSGITVQVPLHQNIIIQQPPAKEEKHEPNLLASFFKKLKRIKNSIFSDRDDNDDDDIKPYPSDNDRLNAFLVYLKPEIGRKR